MTHERQRSFASVDPLTGSPGDPQSFNRYAYVGGNPINFWDPYGLNRDRAKEHTNAGSGYGSPEVVRNHVFNLKPMKSQAFHHAIHGTGPNAMGFVRGRLWHGTTTGHKVTAGVAGLSAAGAGVNCAR